jgi:hypothetical protein
MYVAGRFYGEIGVFRGVGPDLGRGAHMRQLAVALGHVIASWAVGDLT